MTIIQDEPAKEVGPPTHPKPADILTRPRQPKKKQTQPSKKRAKKPTTKPEQTSGGAEVVVEEEALIESLLSQTGEMNLADEPGSGHSPRRSTSTISRKIQGLGEDLKEVAHAVSSSINTSAPVSLIAAKRKSHRHRDKLAKRQAAQLQAQLDAQLELAHNPPVDLRKLEAEGIMESCKSLNLRMIDITPDGHCLFSAIADQLSLKDPTNGPYSYRSCRKLAAEYMRAHREEFIHYLPASDDGLEDGLMSGADYAKYCDLVRDSARWGGEPEILALSKSFKFAIHVVQAFQPVIQIGHDEFFQARDGQALTISYHRKSYGLGEHYNSLRPIL